MNDTHRLSDDEAPRYNWKFVKHIAAKARAQALKEAADLADTYALIANTKSHPFSLNDENIAMELRRLANKAQAEVLPSSSGGC